MTRDEVRKAMTENLNCDIIAIGIPSFLSTKEDIYNRFHRDAKFFMGENNAPLQVDDGLRVFIYAEVSKLHNKEYCEKFLEKIEGDVTLIKMMSVGP